MAFPSFRGGAPSFRLFPSHLSKPVPLIRRWWSGIYNEIFKLLNRDINVQSIIVRLPRRLPLSARTLQSPFNSSRIFVGISLFVAFQDDFGELIYREIDYIAEAANAQRFNELYAGVTDVFVPKVYSDLTTRKVLVMEWVDGYRLTDSASISKYGLDRSKLIDTLVQCSLQQILENGKFVFVA